MQYELVQLELQQIIRNQMMKMFDKNITAVFHLHQNVPRSSLQESLHREIIAGH
jgi:hypothetical protein